MTDILSYALMNHSICCDALSGWCLRSLAEFVLEATWECLEGFHAASTWCSAALSFVGPMVRPDLLGRVSASGARLLLVMEGPLATTNAQTMRLLVALAHGRST